MVPSDKHFCHWKKNNGQHSHYGPSVDFTKVFTPQLLAFEDARYLYLFSHPPPPCLHQSLESVQAASPDFCS